MSISSIIKFCIICLPAIAGIIGCKKNMRPNLSLSHYMYDFGAVKQGEMCTGKIVVYNKGNGDLRIEQVKTDCSCTLVAIEKSKIESKDSAIVNFSLDTSKKYGEICNYIIFEANTDSVIHYVEIYADVR